MDQEKSRRGNLETLHDLMVDFLTTRVKTKEVTPKELEVIAKLLKENGIEASDGRGDPLGMLGDELDDFETQQAGLHLVQTRG